MTRLSIIVPTLNEAEQITASLEALAGWRSAGCEVIVVDGGSTDGTGALATKLADRVLHSPPGRALQMNTGAAAARGDVLLFLHADTFLPTAAREVLNSRVSPGDWGRFDMRLSGDHFLFRLIEAGVNLRSRLSAIATGDQAIFIGCKLFEEIGGFPPIMLMEDVAISVRLRLRRQPMCLRLRVCSSSRRWEQNGILRTILLMWILRLGYALKIDPALLARYYTRRRET